MAETRSALRSRFFTRLGISTASTIATSRADECLNAAVARLLSDGAGGLASRVMIGSTWGSLSATITAHSAKSSSITCGASSFITDGVFEGDIVTIGSNKYLVYEVTSETVLDVGAPILDAQTGDITITRRAVKLPSEGQVGSVVNLAGSDNGRRLHPLPMAIEAGATDHAEPNYFHQGYSDAHDASFISLWPAPSAARRVAVYQSKFNPKITADGTELEWPEPVLDAVLEKMRSIWQTWDGVADPVAVGTTARAVQDTSDEMKNTASAKQVYKRG